MQSHPHTKTPVLSVFSTLLVALLAVILVSACDQKPSAEATAAQAKVLADQAVVEAKKQMADEQAKKDETAAAQAEEKKQRLAAEQKAAAAKARTSKTAAAPAPTPVPTPIPVPEKAIVCDNCGVVVAVKEVAQEGTGSGAGVVAGGVVGGLLGNQFGQGSGRDVATVAGVVGGALLGNKIEKNAKKTLSYDITVKKDTGEQVIVSQAVAPAVVAGDAVKIENGVVVKK